MFLELLKGLVVTVIFLASSNSVAMEWKQLPSLPDREGFASMFAGVSNEALIVAGGANFPDKRPWEGGKKTWYDSVFVLEKSAGDWKVAGRLPRPLAYGVSVTHDGGVVCIGGGDMDRHYADAFRLVWQDGKLVTTPLPSLPKPTANASGALVGSVLYVAGGMEKPDSLTTLNSLWKIDLAAAELRWQELERCPAGGRMLAAASGLKGAFWLAGGVDLVRGNDGKAERRYLADAYRYEPRDGWSRIADLPHSVVAAPSPAPAEGASFYLLGGDDGLQIGVVPEKHGGFSKVILRYDAAANKWTDAGEVVAPRVTAPCVFWNDSWLVPSGEMRPGVRSPEVWSWTREKSG